MIGFLNRASHARFMPGAQRLTWSAPRAFERNQSLIAKSLVGKRFGPDIDEVDHDRVVTWVFGIRDSEQVEPRDGLAVDGESPRRAMGHGCFLPQTMLLTKCIENRAEVVALEVLRPFRPELSLNVFVRRLS